MRKWVRWVRGFPRSSNCRSGTKVSSHGSKPRTNSPQTLGCPQTMQGRVLGGGGGRLYRRPVHDEASRHLASSYSSRSPQRLLHQLLLTHTTGLAVPWSCCCPVRSPFSAPAGTARSTQGRRRTCWMSGGNEEDLGLLSAFAPPATQRVGLRGFFQLAHHRGSIWASPELGRSSSKVSSWRWGSSRERRWLCSWRFGASSPETLSWEHSLSFY